MTRRWSSISVYPVYGPVYPVDHKNREKMGQTMSETGEVGHVLPTCVLQDPARFRTEFHDKPLEISKTWRGLERIQSQ